MSGAKEPRRDNKAVLIRVKFFGPTYSKSSRWQCHADGYPRRFYPRDPGASCWNDARAAATIYAEAVCHYHRTTVDNIDEYSGAYYVSLAEDSLTEGERYDNPATAAADLVAAHPTWDAEAIEYILGTATKEYVPRATRLEVAAAAIAERKG